MSSKKEDDRNEKIIRGLMKLPPNRRCINCNCAGPQYVCTTFWTFVCLSCSGIHREFTHRVKSVSMAKFTKQEVEALQQGGNQRAREIYLKNWDMTRMRLPDSSHPDRIRDFIRSVYVNKKYAGERSSETSPKGTESLKANESELRRPNSYHSFSQSPPYDNQYEERRYGKNSALAPRRLASDRGYEGKVPSFLFSPGRARENVMFEDRFANESSGSRLSDFSVSSAGDQFRYDPQSPNSPYQSNQHSNARPQRTASSGSFGSFDSNSVTESTSEHQAVQLASGSQQSVTSPSSQLPPLSNNQVGTRPALVRAVTSFNQLPTQQPAAPTSSDTSIDLFAGFNDHNTTELNRTLLVGPAVTSPTGPALVRPVTSFNQPPAQQPAASNPCDTSIDLFAGFNEQNTNGLNRTLSAGPAVTSSTGLALGGSAVQFNQPPKQQPAASTPSGTSIDLFSGFNEQNTTGLNITASAGPVVTEVGPASTSMDLFAGFNNQAPVDVKDGGWANFGFSQQKQVFVANTSIQSSPVVTSTGNDLTRGMHPLIGQVPVNRSNAPPQVPQTVAKAPSVNPERFQPWNAFGESSSSGMYATNTQPSMPGMTQFSPGPSAQFSSLAPVAGNEVAKLSTPPAVRLPAHTPMAPVSSQPQSVDQWFASARDANVSAYQGISQDFIKSDIPSVAALSSLNGPTSLTGEMPASLQPLQGMPYQAMQSTNPFDFPDESDLPNNTFMDMSHMQAALPAQQPDADYYSSGAFRPEFYTQNPTSTYASHLPQGDMQQMRDQAPPQILNPTPQGYPSLGSNPFA
ncbi:uncharacterized protein LOC144575590 isoform X1 [Carex rostrata]